MVIKAQDHTSFPAGAEFDTAWRRIYPSLRARIKHLVYTFHIPCWYGQEEDIIEDILQETARRTIERSQKVEHGEASPVQVFEHMVMVIASNYCKDLRRKDKRLMRIVDGNHFTTMYDRANCQHDVDLAEIATERANQEALFTHLADEIAKFPSKQRRELLTDLANRMSFEVQPTPLQKAFLKVGLHLQDYRQPISDAPGERSRRAALLHHAYKRLAQLSCMQQYKIVA